MKALLQVGNVWQSLLVPCYELTLNLEPVIVTSSHSWPMVKLLDQVQLGMVCVQVKLFPSWSTSVTTLWSVLALRNPVTEQVKFQIDKFNKLSMNDSSHLPIHGLCINKKNPNTNCFQELLIVLLTLQLIFPGERHDGEREEVRKEFNRRRGVACYRYSLCALFDSLPNLPLPFLSNLPNRVSPPSVWWMSVYPGQFVTLFSATVQIREKVPDIPLLLSVSGFSSTSIMCDGVWFASLIMYGVVKHLEHKIQDVCVLRTCYMYILEMEIM